MCSLYQEVKKTKKNHGGPLKVMKPCKRLKYNWNTHLYLYNSPDHK